MDIKEIILSRKYAQAFINAYKDKLNVSDLNRLKAFIDFLKNHAESNFFLSLVTLKNQVKQLELEKIIKKLELPIEFNNLVKLLLKDNRLFLLGDVAFYIRELLKQKLNISEFKIKTSHKVSKEFIDNIINFLSTKINKKILYTTEIDKNLIAGVKAYSENYLLDYTIENKLRKLNTLFKFT